jgi:hypothetical protein
VTHRTVIGNWAAPLCIFLALGHIAFTTPCQAGQQSSSAPPAYRLSDAHTRSGFDHFYNLDYDRAVREFELAFKRHSDSPLGANHLLTAVLFRELYRMGLLDTASYASNGFVSQPHRPADPKVKARITELIGQASQLSEKRLSANPKDVDALYARGVTRGLLATYTGLVERSWFAALRSALSARHDHERVLELNPKYTDAKLVVGIHNYIVGSLPMAVKLGAAVVGIGGSKAKGIEYLNEVAQSDGEAATDAKIALGLFLRRERRYPEALDSVRSLTSSYPQNFLIAMEEPNLLRASGQLDHADALYRRLLQAGREGRFPHAHYEQAAYELGETLRNQKNYEAAAEAYNLVDQVSNADPEVCQRANLAAGEMYDILRKRDLAVKKYRAVVAVRSDTELADDARKYLKEAYRE